MKRVFCLLIFVLGAFATEANFQDKNSLNILDFQDPFFDNQGTSLKKDLILQAILNDKAKINHHWYQEKDFIDQVQLIEIHKDYVLIDEHDKQYQIYLQRPNHKVIIY